MDLCEFEVYRESSRTGSKATPRNPVSKKQKNTDIVMQTYNLSLWEVEAELESHFLGHSLDNMISNSSKVCSI